MTADEYSNNELMELDKISDDLVIELFYTTDKRYAIMKALKKAFRLALPTRDSINAVDVKEFIRLVKEELGEK